MKISFLLLGLLLAVAVHPGRESAQDAVPVLPAAPAPDPWISAAARQLRTADIARLEIVVIPISVESPVPITPESLEQHADYRVIVNDFPRSPWKPNLLAALDASHAHPDAGPFDCRWGCLFYDNKGTRVLTLYLDGLGGHALLDGTQLTVDRPLASLLDRRCSPLWLGS